MPSSQTQSAAVQPKLRIGFVLAPEFTLTALSGFLDVLRLAADEEDRSRQILCSWTVLSPNRSVLRSSCGLDVLPQSSLVDPTRFDYVAVIGGLLRSHAQISPEIPRYLQEAARCDVGLVGACTGSFILARAGLMDGRRCCVHHCHAAQFAADFPDIDLDAESLFIVDGPRITCPGGGSVIDMALYLVERHCGRHRARKVLSTLIIEHARRHNHPQCTLPMNCLAAVRDPIVRRALLLMQRTLGATCSIAVMCDALGVDMKTLERRFQSSLRISPRKCYRQMRVENARRLIEQSPMSLTEIAFECGFADASHLTRSCRELLGVTPSQLRRASGDARPGAYIAQL
jgi:transcriptional regulator GlxA family with amidase domain